MPPRPRHPHPPASAWRDLPDWAVLTDAETSAAVSLSEDTLLRLDATGDGIPRTELSERRHGRTVGNIKAWLERRTANGGSDAA